MAKTNGKASTAKLAKAPTGIAGARRDHRRRPCPRGRPTLVCGGRGLRQDAARHGVPGQRRHRVRRARRVHGLRGDAPRSWPQNVGSLGFDLDELVAPARSSSSTTCTSSAARSRRPASTTSRGCSSASGYAIDSIGAKRVVLDTIEALFAGLSNQAILRAELRRLFRWLKDKGVTAVITGERGDGHAHPPGPGGVRLRLRDPARPPRHRPGLHPPAAHRQVPRLRARHQRVPVPHRRARHLGPADHLARRSTTRRPTSGSRPASPRLDAMLGGKGFYRGSSVLVSGTAGTGKTQPRRPLRRRRLPRAASAASTSRSRSRKPDRPQHALDRARPASRWIKKGLLRFHAARPTLDGLEMHLAAMHRLIAEFEPRRGRRRPDQQPRRRAGPPDEVKAMLLRLIDFLKTGRSPPCSPA